MTPLIKASTVSFSGSPLNIDRLALMPVSTRSASVLDLSWVVEDQLIVVGVEDSALDFDVYDLDVFIWFIVLRVCFDFADGHHHVHSLDNASEYRVLVVQPRLK